MKDAFRHALPCRVEKVLHYFSIHPTRRPDRRQNNESFQSHNYCRETATFIGTREGIVALLLTLSVSLFHGTITMLLW